MSFDVSDLESVNLDDPDEYAEASAEVAKTIADEFGNDFVRADGDKVFVSAEVLTMFAQADVINGIEAGMAGEEELAITLFKTAVTLNAVVDEAKARA